MTSKSKKTELSLIAGCFRGLTHLLVNFTQSAEEGYHWLIGLSLFEYFVAEAFNDSLFAVCLSVMGQLHGVVETFASVKKADSLSGWRCQIDCERRWSVAEVLELFQVESTLKISTSMCGWHSIKKCTSLAMTCNRQRCS